MYVICLEGCHGSGKTELRLKFEEAGLRTLDEAFIDAPTFRNVHPQSLVSETIWMSHWFARILRHAEEADSENAVYIADRSPYSAVFYARHRGTALEPIIDAQIEELRAHNVHILTVCLKVEPELLWGRICARLRREPHREQYNEGSREWMEKTVAFYESRRWDYVVHNNEHTIGEVMATLTAALASRVSLLRQISPPSPVIKRIVEVSPVQA